jgi:hypothetical protein
LRKIALIDRFYVRQFGYFLEKLKGAMIGEERLLDRTLVTYGGGIGDGDRHNHDNLPILLAGGKADGVQHGRRWVLEGEVPMTNLHLGILERMGVKAERVGDSSGVLSLV